MKAVTLNTTTLTVSEAAKAFRACEVLVLRVKNHNALILVGAGLGDKVDWSDLLSGPFYDPPKTAESAITLAIEQGCKVLTFYNFLELAAYVKDNNLTVGV